MNNILRLFFLFFRIGLLSIGGGYAIIPLIQEQVVGNTGWISDKTFTDIITISQMTPGPLAVNTSTFVGLQIGGIPGAIAATLGCIFCGVIISLFLYKFFQTHQNSTYVLEVLNGLKSASLGLIISAACTMIFIALFGSRTPETGTFFTTFNWTALFIFFSAILLLRRRKTNPIIIMLISGAAGFIFYQS